MDNSQEAILNEPSRLEIIRLYLLEELKLEEIQHDFQRRQAEPGPQLSLDQWKGFLRKENIFKNLCEEQAASIESRLGQITGAWNYLIIVSDVVLDNIEVAKRCKRMRRPLKEFQALNPRVPTIIPLSFDFAIMSQPDIFKNFQRLLFNIRVHFETSFDNGKWASDDRGLYARSAKLRAGLSELSNLHNIMCDALKQFKAGKSNRGWALIRTAFLLHESIVNSDHHRQLLDIIAILLLIKRDGHDEIHHLMTRNLLVWARERLSPDDPRRIMFELLENLPLDSSGHLYLAFDAYCRHLWMERAGSDEINAHYSYNQSSFPRADTGDFYKLYQGKSLEDISSILKKVDMKFGEYSHDTFCLWHTAIRYLWRETRYEEMIHVSKSLCMRLECLMDGFYYTYHRQLNLDVSLTFYLLGVAQEGQGYIVDARMAFEQSVILRSQSVLSDTWDGCKAAALKKLELIATRVGDESAATCYKEILARMYSAVEAKIKAEEQSDFAAMVSQERISEASHLRSRFGQE